MIIEKLIFNFLALFFFVFIFFKMIKKNDTSYITILIIQMIGISLNFLEIIFNIFTEISNKIIMYLFSVILPLIVCYLETKNIVFLEIKNITLAKICMILKLDKKAKKLFIDLVTKYPENYKGHKMLGKIYEKEGGMRKAIDEYVKAIDIKNNDYDTYYKIAFLLQELDKNKEAETMLTNLIKIKPDYYEASNLLGEVLCKQNRFKEAINIYMDALKYRPEDYELYYNLGIVYTMINDFQNAKMCYEKAAQINHELYNAHYSLGQLALLSHDLDLAEKYFTESLYGEDVEAKSYFQLAKIYMAKNNKEKAIIFINKAIELDIQYSKKIDEEPIFMPIRKYIIIPEQAHEEPKNELRLEEMIAQKHLEETYNVVKDMEINNAEKDLEKKEEIERNEQIENDEKTKIE